MATFALCVLQRIDAGVQTDDFSKDVMWEGWEAITKCSAFAQQVEQLQKQIDELLYFKAHPPGLDDFDGEATAQEAQHLEAESEKRRKELLRKQCYKLVTGLMKERNARIFNEAVDVNMFRDYLKFVSRPMDFGTIKANLEQDKYHTPSEMRTDMEQVFHNARLYNPVESHVVQAAQQLEGEFDKRYQAISDAVMMDTMQQQWERVTLQQRKQRQAKEIFLKEVDSNIQAVLQSSKDLLPAMEEFSSSLASMCRPLTANELQQLQQDMNTLPEEYKDQVVSLACNISGVSKQALAKLQPEQVGAVAFCLMQDLVRYCRRMVQQPLPQTYTRPSHMKQCNAPSALLGQHVNNLPAVPTPASALPIVSFNKPTIDKAAMQLGRQSILCKGGNALVEQQSCSDKGGKFSSDYTQVRSGEHANKQGCDYKQAQNMLQVMQSIVQGNQTQSGDVNILQSKTALGAQQHKVDNQTTKDQQQSKSNDIKTDNKLEQQPGEVAQGSQVKQAAEVQPSSSPAVNGTQAQQAKQITVQNPIAQRQTDACDATDSKGQSGVCSDINTKKPVISSNDQQTNQSTGQGIAEKAASQPQTQTDSTRKVDEVCEQLVRVGCRNDSTAKPDGDVAQTSCVVQSTQRDGQTSASVAQQYTLDSQKEKGNQSSQGKEKEGQGEGVPLVQRVANILLKLSSSSTGDAEAPAQVTKTGPQGVASVGVSVDKIKKLVQDMQAQDGQQVSVEQVQLLMKNVSDIEAQCLPSGGVSNTKTSVQSKVVDGAAIPAAAVKKAVDVGEAKLNSTKSDPGQSAQQQQSCDKTQQEAQQPRDTTNHVQTKPKLAVQIPQDSQLEDGNATFDVAVGSVGDTVKYPQRPAADMTIGSTHAVKQGQGAQVLAGTGPASTNGAAPQAPQNKTGSTERGPLPFPAIPIISLSPGIGAPVLGPPMPYDMTPLQLPAAPVVRDRQPEPGQTQGRVQKNGGGQEHDIGRKRRDKVSGGGIDGLENKNGRGDAGKKQQGGVGVSSSSPQANSRPGRKSKADGDGGGGGGHGKVGRPRTDRSNLRVKFGNKNTEYEYTDYTPRRAASRRGGVALNGVGNGPVADVQDDVKRTRHGKVYQAQPEVLANGKSTGNSGQSSDADVKLGGGGSLQGQAQGGTKKEQESKADNASSSQHNSEEQLKVDAPLPSSQHVPKAQEQTCSTAKQSSEAEANGNAGGTVSARRHSSRLASSNSDGVEADADTSTGKTSNKRRLDSLAEDGQSAQTKARKRANGSEQSTPQSINTASGDAARTRSGLVRNKPDALDGGAATPSSTVPKQNNGAGVKVSPGHTSGARPGQGVTGADQSLLKVANGGQGHGEAVIVKGAPKAQDGSQAAPQTGLKTPTVQSSPCTPQGPVQGQVLISTKPNERRPSALQQPDPIQSVQSTPGVPASASTPLSQLGTLNLHNQRKVTSPVVSQAASNAVNNVPIKERWQTIGKPGVEVPGTGAQHVTVASATGVRVVQSGKMTPNGVASPYPFQNGSPSLQQQQQQTQGEARADGTHPAHAVGLANGGTKVSPSLNGRIGSSDVASKASFGMLTSKIGTTPCVLTQGGGPQLVAHQSPVIPKPHKELNASSTPYASPLIPPSIGDAQQAHRPLTTLALTSPAVASSQAASSPAILKRYPAVQQAQRTGSEPPLVQQSQDRFDRVLLGPRSGSVLYRPASGAPVGFGPKQGTVWSTSPLPGTGTAGISIRAHTTPTAVTKGEVGGVEPKLNTQHAILKSGGKVSVVEVDSSTDDQSGHHGGRKVVQKHRLNSTPRGTCTPSPIVKSNGKISVSRSIAQVSPAARAQEPSNKASLLGTSVTLQAGDVLSIHSTSVSVAQSKKDGGDSAADCVKYKVDKQNARKKADDGQTGAQQDAASPAGKESGSASAQENVPRLRSRGPVPVASSTPSNRPPRPQEAVDVVVVSPTGGSQAAGDAVAPVHTKVGGDAAEVQGAGVGEEGAQPEHGAADNADLSVRRCSLAAQGKGQGKSVSNTNDGKPTTRRTRAQSQPGTPKSGRDADASGSRHGGSRRSRDAVGGSVKGGIKKEPTASVCVSREDSDAETGAFKADTSSTHQVGEGGRRSRDAGADGSASMRLTRSHGLGAEDDKGHGPPSSAGAAQSAQTVKKGKRKRSGVTYADDVDDVLVPVHLDDVRDKKSDQFSKLLLASSKTQDAQMNKAASNDVSNAKVGRGVWCRVAANVPVTSARSTRRSHGRTDADDSNSDKSQEQSSHNNGVASTDSQLYKFVEYLHNYQFCSGVVSLALKVVPSSPQKKRRH